MHEAPAPPAIQAVASTQSDVADMIVAYLAQIGVEYVFGVPGGAIEPLYNALARSMQRGGPRPVVARHESGAAFMADGYARETGKLGVCCATSGPGTTNLITGVACAYDNNIPLLVLTGQPTLPTFGKRALQESACTGVNTLAMFRHCTRYNSLVSHPQQSEHKLIDAIMHALGTPSGPSHLSMPVDVQRMGLDHTGPAYDLNKILTKPQLIDESGLQTLQQIILSAQKIAILIGEGAHEAVGSILTLASMLNAPFIVSPDAKGYINPHHPAYRGVFGFAGHASANAVLKDNPDIILAFGVSMNEWTSGAWSANLLNERLIHIDARENHLSRSPMARLHVRGHIGGLCKRLVHTLQTECPPHLEAVGATHPAHPERHLQEPAKYRSESTPIKPQRLMRELSVRCPPTTRFVADAGNSTTWAVHYLTLQDRRFTPSRSASGNAASLERRSQLASWLRVTMDFAPMGWAIGAAIGIARANPDGPVVCITGDGSYLMNGQEITVAYEENLPVIFVILNDSALGMVKHGQRIAKAEPIAYHLPRIDYRLIAESMGIAGYVIESPDDFDAIDFDAILRCKAPTLLDVRVDGEEAPPMGVRMQALGIVP